MKEKFGQQQPENPNPNDPKKGLAGPLGIPPPPRPEQQPQGGVSRSPKFDLPAQGEGPAPVDGGSESAPVQPTPQKEGRIDELIQFLGGYDVIREAYVREKARRYLAESYYKVVPDPEEEAWFRERERKYLETATPEEKHEFYKKKLIRNLNNLRHTSDQIDALEIHSPDYVAELQQLDPEFMDPLISALRQRPLWQRREKAFDRLQRLRQRRTNDRPQGSDD